MRSRARTEVFEAIDSGGAPRQVPSSEAGVVEVLPYSESLGSVYRPRFHDLDGDGDLDIVAADTRINTLRDLEVRPRARFGRPLAVRIVDRTLDPGKTAMVFVSAAPARIPVPGLGSILLDTSQALVETGDVTAESGTAEVLFELPPIAVALPRPIFVQAVLLDGNGLPKALTARATVRAW